MITIEKATQAHAQDMAPRMRLDDQREVWASSGTTPIEALMKSIGSPGEHWAALDDGKVVAMFGISQCSMLGAKDVGVPWLLGGDGLEHNGKVLLRVSRHFINEASRQFEMLGNFVDARHTVAIRWLEWLGFTMERAKPYGFAGLPFHRFELRR